MNLTYSAIRVHNFEVSVRNDSYSLVPAHEGNPGSSVV